MGKIILFLFLVALLWGGGTNVYHAVYYRTPPVTTLARTPASALPTFVTLRDITFEVDHLLKLKLGTEILFIPIKAKGAPKDSQYTALIQTSAPELLAALTSQTPEATKLLATLAQRTEVSGRVSRRSGSDRQVKEIRKVLPLVSEEVVIIDEGATPALVQGIIMLTLGTGFVALAVAGAFKKVPHSPKLNP